MGDVLRLGVVLSAVWAGGALAAQWHRARVAGRRDWFSIPAAPPLRGIAWALGPGLSPTAKESVREHLPAYFLGIAYHAGIFVALGILAGVLVGAPLQGPLSRVAGGLSLLGTMAGLALLVRRRADRHLRAISCPDDFLANILATGLTALAGLRIVTPGAGTGLAAMAILLFLYVPLGKIRHCLFFFTTRAHMGAWFGRRGVLPPAT